MDSEEEEFDKTSSGLLDEIDEGMDYLGGELKEVCPAVVVEPVAKLVELTGLVDFHLVTKWKTAGDSLFAASRLVRPGARRFLLVGAGKVAQSM
eukprot:gene49845-66775_t